MKEQKTDHAPAVVTTAHAAPAAAEPLLDDVSIAVLAPGHPGVRPHWELAPLTDGLRMLSVRAEGVPVEIRFSVPLADAAGYWHPKGGWRRTLVADWEGLSQVCLVDGPAAGCLYEHSGATLLTFAAADPVPEATVRFGVSEENDTHVVHLSLPASAEPHRLLLVPRAPSVATAVRPLRTWFAAAHPPMPVPDAARLPAYSTWYAFNQDVTADAVEAQAGPAAELGCGVLILDDGWQRFGNGRGYAGCGDWQPDPAKFPDLAGHVARVRALGLHYLLWVAPLLLGPEADCHDRWAASAPAPATVPGGRVLDPRLPDVRRHVVELCVSLVREYGVDGLKLDFLDEAAVYSGDGAGDVGRAMTELLTEVRGALEAVRPGLLLELRQPYVGPGMAPFGNMLRSFDCPADATANRVRILDTTLLAVGGAVHSDMVMWSRSAPVETVARQLIGALHAVPQISVRLDELPPEHLAAVRFWLGRWHLHRELLLDGRTEPGRPDELYPLVVAARGDECLVSVHGDRVVELDFAAYRRFHLVNGSDRDRVMVEVTGGGPVAARVHGPDGRMMNDPLTLLPEGPRSLAVPRGGLVSLVLTEGPR
ncbi:glycoside hydrolase family 36 protein [Streptomyces sp. NBC_00094]|uniref:glycoside hydrolase family 36 protein n=1 Tax=Streptomyces sp. NBC_00094 TaxID=2903620 RepID=UPI00225469A9|nr:glycoside hydrolase family 36 protein [Streptomyces sp. NBC_00094]MCX5394823.1 alpha-galactosidase [Streptomyces sp. NBC_00094]